MQRTVRAAAGHGRAEGVLCAAGLPARASGTEIQ